MLPKVRLVFDRKKVCDNKSEGDVEVYVYHLGKKRYLATGVRCRKREYKEGTISVRADAVELNKRLQWCLVSIQKQVNEMVEQDCVNLSCLSLSLSDRNSDFLEWVTEMICNRDIKDSTKGKLLNVVSIIREKGIFKSFADINLANVEKFNVALRGLKVGTRRVYNMNLKFFIKMAVNAGLVNFNPYDRYELPKEDRVNTIRYLTEEELRMIEKVDVRLKMEFTRDVFLFGCYTGLRSSDIKAVSRGNCVIRNGVKWLQGEQQKTGNRYDIMLLPESERILDKYNWDMSGLSTSLVNTNLKRLALLAGVNKVLTMHMSRHTFATRALSKGVRMEVVSKMLGHTDIKMTQVYAKVLHQDVEKGFELLMS